MSASKPSVAAVRLRAYLAQHKKPQAKFAMLELGVTDTTIGAWLAGKMTPSLENAYKIQKLTDIPMTDWLVTEESPP